MRKTNKEGNLMIDENRLHDFDGGEHFDDSDYFDRYNHGRQLFRKK